MVLAKRGKYSFLDGGKKIPGIPGTHSLFERLCLVEWRSASRGRFEQTGRVSRDRVARGLVLAKGTKYLKGCYHRSLLCGTGRFVVKVKLSPDGLQCAR